MAKSRADGITVTIDLGKLPALLDRADDVATNQKKFGILKRAARVLAASWWGETFRQQGARRGHAKWRALSPRYAARKASRGRSPTILLLTGHLMGSDKVLRDGKNFLFYGTNVPYAVHHQVGSRTLPRREIAFVTDQDLDELSSFIARLLDEEFREVL